MRTGFVKVEKGAFGSKEIPEDQLPVHLEYGWTLVSAEPPTPKEVLHVVTESKLSGTIHSGGGVSVSNTQFVDTAITMGVKPTRKPKKSGK